MKKTLYIISFLIFASTIAVASNDTMAIRTSDGEWLKVMKLKEYKNVPDNFNSGDFEQIEKCGYVNKVIGEKTVSYFLSPKLPFLFSRQRQTIQRYTIDPIRTTITKLGEPFVDMRNEKRQPETLYAIPLFILVISIIVSFLLPKYIPRNIFRFYGILFISVIFGGVFNQYSNAVVLGALFLAYISADFLESDDYDFPVTFGPVLSIGIGTIAVMFFSQNNIREGAFFATTLVIFAGIVFAVRAGYEIVAKNKIIKEKNNI